MIFEYTPETDTLYIQFKRAKDVEGENINSRTVGFFTEANELSAIEIEHAKKAVDVKTIEINGKVVDWSKALSKPTGTKKKSTKKLRR
jgi:uncharacterized protein YuzE